MRTSNPKQLATLLIEHCDIESLKFTSKTEILFSTPSASQLFKVIPEIIQQHKIMITEIRSTDDSLNTLFSMLMKLHRGELMQRGR
ncbi:MAG: hypothetical protein GY748_00435 [Planctomycetaceae bacterium]|nr:hypothetical protein [Planctomycetaceae bacterium]